MSTENVGDLEVAGRPKKINLRRPDIMEQVQAQVLSHYRSEIVEKIRANGGVLLACTIYLDAFTREVVAPA